MRNNILFLGLLIVVFSVSGCKKSPELLTDHIPVFSDTIAVNVSLKKVAFSVSYDKLNPADADECGFEWGERQSTTRYNVSAANITANYFGAQAIANLNQSVQYEVRAWVKTNEKKLYSAPTYFFGIAAVRPEIISINKSYAMVGDIITIKVKNLDPDITASDIKVFIQYEEMQPISVNTDEIKVIMPFLHDQGMMSVKILANNIDFINTTEIKNALPDITSVNPGWIKYGDSIVVKGKFWLEYSNRITPVVGYNIKYKLVSYKDDELILKFPDEVACEATHKIDFALASSPGNTAFDYYSSDRSVNMYGYWNELTNTPVTLGSKSVLLNNEVYMLEYGNSIFNDHFWKYNPATNQWTALNDFPGYVTTNQTLVICNGEIYAGFVSLTGQSTNFYKYSRQNNYWSPCANLPIDYDVDYITTFVQSGKIYAFLGGRNKKGIYDPTTDTWTMSNCIVPSFNDNVTVFNYMGDYYFFKARNGNYIYKFDLGAETFSAVTIEGLSSAKGSLFRLNGKYYCSGECKMYEFDMGTKKLIEHPEFSNYLTSFNFNYENIAYQFTFGNKAYFLFDPGKFITLNTEGK